MANIQLIVDTATPAANAIALKMGVDITGSAVELRTVVRVSAALTGVVIGVLVDQGVLKGGGQALKLSDFAAALTAALAQDYTPTPPYQPPPGS